MKQEQEEIAIISAYLPKQMSDAEMTAAIEAAIKETGAAGMKDMGKVIGVLRGKYAGQMDFGQGQRPGEGEARGLSTFCDGRRNTDSRAEGRRRPPTTISPAASITPACAGLANACSAAGMMPPRTRGSTENSYWRKSASSQPATKTPDTCRSLRATVSIEFKEFHIDAPFQNRGIGSEVMRLLLAEAREGSKPVTVSVIEFNPALSFYERAGFRVIGREGQKLFMWHDGGDRYFVSLL